MHLANLMTAARACMPLLLMGRPSIHPTAVQQAAFCTLEIHLVLVAAVVLRTAGLLHGTASHTGPAQQAYHPGVQAVWQQQ